MLAYISTWLLLVIYSFTLQDFNLTLYNYPIWNQVRHQLQNLGYFNRPLAAVIFVILISLIIWLYWRIIKSNLKIPVGKTLIKPFLLFCLFGLVAYPLFSHDIFNYIFNAKMVIIYKVNPHIQTAIQFSSDLWTRFMHNVHTPAPYAYGWTVLSLIPGIATLFNNFTIAFFSMKLFIYGFLLLQLYILRKIILKLFPQQSWRWWLFALNPLVLTETLIMGHNDVVMMSLVLISFWFLLKSKKIFDQPWSLAICFLLISASIKYATIVLLPLYLFKQLTKKLDFSSIASILLLLIMFVRPDQLHSWYLIWAFSFAVLSRSRLVISIFTALTLGALLRYTPYIYYGHWDSPVYPLRNLIWLGALVFIPCFYKLTDGKTE